MKIKINKKLKNYINPYYIVFLKYDVRKIINKVYFIRSTLSYLLKETSE